MSCTEALAGVTAQALDSGLSMRTSALAVAALLSVACGQTIQDFGLEEPLPDGLSHVWQVRAWHADDLWVPAGDSLDLVLLRDRCGVPVGAGQKGCYSDQDSSARARWAIAQPRLARIRPLPRGSWEFGPGSAGARIYGRNPGTTLVRVRLPQGTFQDTVYVVPSFQRLRIEPRDSAYVAGDTVWFRVLGLDATGRTATALRWPLSFGRQVGPAAADGAVPIVFDHVTHPSVATPVIVIHIGSKADTLRFRVIAPPAPSSPASALPAAFIQIPQA